MNVRPEAQEMTVFRDAGERFMRSESVILVLDDTGADIFGVTLLAWKND